MSQNPTLKRKVAEINFLKYFPFDIFGEMRPAQKHTLEVASQTNDNLIFEAPTGSGKTAIGYAFLKGIADHYDGPQFYLVPNKTHVDQFKKQFPTVKVAYGRSEYPCLYYGELEKVTAQESPCYMLKCKHRVNQDTGETEELGVSPCPYYQAKYEAKQGGMVVATTAFFLYSTFYSREFKESVSGIVFDEAHMTAEILRHSLSFDITDYHLNRCIDVLMPIDKRVAVRLRTFKNRMVYFIKKRSRPNMDLLLKENEINELISILSEIKGKDLIKKVREKVQADKIDRESLKRLQDITYGIGRYVRSLKYATLSGTRKPLAYTYGYVKEEMGENDKVKYRLSIRSYYIAGIVKSMTENARVMSYSATIGNEQIFRNETGLSGDFESLTSHFDPDNSRIFLPSDVFDLSHDKQRKQDKTKTLRKIARAAKKFADKGLRSLVLVVSDQEREKFLMLADEEGLDVATYSKDVLARDVVNQFKAGKGDVLLGTGANFGQGIDLPDGMAPITFILRPEYPHPNDPLTQFEDERHGSRKWALWQWRVAIKAVQGRGRNIRSAEDRGVTFFMSAQYRRFLRGSLPGWLRESYHGSKTFEECVEETEKLLLK